MQVYQAKNIARRWVEEVGSQDPDFVGAFFAGSINWMNEDASFPHLSDVDIIVLVDREISGWSEQAKFQHQGILLEAVFRPLERFRSPEQVLCMIDAINLAIPSIISDPTGHLTELHQAVAQQYASRKWVQRRCEQVRQNIQTENLETMEHGECLIDRVRNLIYAVIETAQIPAIAQLQSPTIRKCLVVSRTILVEMDRLDLHESLLRFLGSAEMNRQQVEVHCQECTRAFDRAIQVICTPFWGDFRISREMRPAAIDGAWELIDSGYPREAILWIQSIHSLALIAIQNDAPAEETARFMQRYRVILAELGYDSPAAFQQRARYGRTVLDEMMRFADEIVEKQRE